MKSIIIAGTHSGVGKTTASIAIMRAFTKIGKKVAPFKVGPDFIDPKFHYIATNQKSYNLDSWLINEEYIKYLFKKHLMGKDISVIEGVMGLYDGCGKETIGSTAHIAKIVDAPIILVVDAKGIYNSIVALINGYISYDNDIKIQGVILNNVSTESHYLLLKEIIENEIDIKCLGYFSLNKKMNLKSRHLGLIPIEEIKNINEIIEYLGQLALKNLDIEKILKISDISDISIKDISIKDIGKIGKNLRIAIAMDEAFSFYYEDNLELMEESGIELIKFSPLADKELPENINGVYIGGGFPEIFAKELSLNNLIKKDILDKAENGLPFYCECGGLMYLTKGIIDKKDNLHDMVGFFNCKSKMTERLQRFGYIEIEFENIKIKAHEFHHSKLIDIDDSEFTYKYKIKKFNKNLLWKCGLKKKNVLAGYPHVHFYSNFEFFRRLIVLFRRNNND